MALLPLSKLSDWELEDTGKDLRGLKLVDRSGHTIGTINELLVDTDRARVDSVRTDDGRLFAVEPLEIRDSEVIFQDERAAIDEGNCCGPISVVSRPGSRARVYTAGGGRWRSANKLRSTGLMATDGDIGELYDIYFDDQSWTIRYLVVDTSKWLPGRKVLISPEAILPSTSSEDSVRLNLTRDQIRNSPLMDTERPVSRQRLSGLHSYYGWGVPPIMPVAGLEYSYEPAIEADVDQHLRSMKEVIGYHIEASDGNIGHVDDFAVDTDTLRIRSLIVDTSNMPGGRSVMVPVHLVTRISFPDQRMQVRASRDEIRRMPQPGPELQP